MPDLDLGPDDYRVRDPKSGRWFQRDSKPALLGIAAMCFGLIAFIWLVRDQISADSNGMLIFVVMMVGGAGGAALALAFKDVY